MVLDLTPQLEVKEIKKSDVKGKNFVFCVTPNGQEASQVMFSATNDQQLSNWVKAIRAVKTAFEVQR